MRNLRIATISDIHSNHLALMAVLKEIEKDIVDLIVCARDLVGYSPQPNAREEIMIRDIPTV